MSDLPQPEGTPLAFALHSDPWAEQARRHAAHLADRRSRRRRRLVRVGAPLVVLLLGATTVAVIVVSAGHGDDADAESIASAVGAPITAVVQSPPPTSTTVVQTEVIDAASVDEVWLLDRGDGSYDWGAIVSSASNVVRLGLDVTVTLLDSDGNEVHTDEIGIAQLVPGGEAVIGGVATIADATPTRIEVRSTLGRAAPDAVIAALTVSDARRVGSGQVDRDDRLVGTIEVVGGAAQAGRVAALWRDPAGSVIAAVFEVVDMRGTGQRAAFSLRLPRTMVPAGEPDDIVANATVLN